MVYDGPDLQEMTNIKSRLSYYSKYSNKIIVRTVSYKINISTGIPTGIQVNKFSLKTSKYIRLI